MPTLRLKVTLRHVQPPVIRVLDVPKATTLPELHDLLQVALGWTDSHLHQWADGERSWGVIDLEWAEDEDLDEATMTLAKMPTAFTYLYDFGDSWEHDVVVLGAGEEPGFVYGEGDCPPEDVGGTSGYAEFLTVMADPKHADHEHMSAWAEGMFRPFDAERTATAVRRTLGSVPASVRTLLEVLGPQTKLTQAGRIPPAVVALVRERLPHWDDYGAPREDNVLELWRLKDYLCEVGVLRKSRGVLHQTKACGDDADIVRRLRKGYPDGEFHTLLVTSALAVLAVDGPLTHEALATRVLPMMGHRWQMNGRELDETGLRSAWYGETALLRALDLVTMEMRKVSAGPSALTLLPRATALADLLHPQP